MNRATFAIVSLFLLFFAKTTCAWNALGHKLIVQIAYDHLTPAAKQRSQHYNRAVDKTYAGISLVAAAPWLDRQRDSESLQMSGYFHYIDQPLAIRGLPCAAPYPINAVTSINKAVAVLKNPEISTKEKGLQLRILVHVVADLHQPLHAVNRCSRLHPKGDRGATLFRLGKNPIAMNLHAYWDKGGGLLLRRYSGIAVQKWANVLEKKQACSSLNLDFDPLGWAKESYEVATQDVYQLQERRSPPKAYMQATRKKTEHQLILAGCRLAKLLNSLIT